MNGILLLAGVVLVTMAVWFAAGFAPAVAVLALAGGFRSEALHRGARARLRTAAREVEEAAKAQAALQERYDALPLVALTVHQQGEEAADDEDEGRTIH